jgi:hypothetical protein
MGMVTGLAAHLITDAQIYKSWYLEGSRYFFVPCRVAACVGVIYGLSWTVLKSLTTTGVYCIVLASF